VVNEITVPKTVAAMRREYASRSLATTVPFAGVPRVLVTLRARGVKTAVLSNKPEAATRAIVEALFAQDAFDAVRGAVDGVPLKPDPTSCLAILSRIGVRPEDAVFVGDTPIDILTGVNAGVPAAGVTWGFRPADELLDAGADHIIHHPLDLLALLGETIHREADSGPVV
jgi:phosphoglycolate phosphatase